MICRHCGREIQYVANEGWVEPEATGDDIVWFLTCDLNESFDARHEPEIPTPADDIEVW